MEVLQAAAAGVGAVTVILGALWWLLRPRVETFARDLLRATSHNAAQLAPGGELHDNAAAAAQAANELPELRRDVSDFAENTRGRLDNLEGWRTGVDRQLGLFEQALVAILGDELHRRLDTAATDRRTSRDQTL